MNFATSLIDMRTYVGPKMLRQSLRATVLAVSICALGPLQARSARADTPIVTIEVSKGKLADVVDHALRSAAPPGFGGALIVEQRGKLILKAGYGYADREHRIPFSADTIAQIGSISKTFTAAAIADLESHGKVDPTSQVSEYLPELAEKPAGAITVRQLLTHTGGYPEYCGDDFDRASIEKLLRECLAPLNAKPGTYVYSNVGYSALALIVERVSGKSLETYLRDHITGPLGMRNSGYAIEGALPRRFASGYLNGVNQGVISDRISALRGDYWNLKGNGGIQATSSDMIIWGKAVFGLRKGGPALAITSRLADRGTWLPSSQPNTFYSYGLFVARRQDGSVQRISHSGSDGVFLSLLRWYPEEKVLMYFVGNSGEDEVKRLLLATLDAMKKAAPLRD